MIRAWRIVREARAAEAFTGEGARRYGGRWNSPGTSVVYSSAHLSLAALETLVHLEPRGSLQFVAIAIEFEEAWIEELPIGDLPAHWRAEPPGAGTMMFGDAWARRGETPVLAVPSIVVPQEINYVINPLHAAFHQLRIQRPEPFSFDPRLIE